MTRVRDVIERKVRFLLKNTKQAHVPHHAHARLSYYTMIITFRLIEILSQGEIDTKWNASLVKYFFINYT